MTSALPVSAAAAGVIVLALAGGAVLLTRAGSDEGVMAAAAGADACASGVRATGGEAAIPGGDFVMGSDAYYPEEGPARGETVKAFRIDVHEVTNAQFAEFVEATGYVTVAERAPDPADYPGIDPDLLVPGSAVFVAPEGPVGPGEGGSWWRFVPEASWRAPMGPGSDLAGMGAYPVVHVAYEDAAAYADWAGRRLPSEAEWERAARAGLDQAPYEWGAELTPDDEWRANGWQGPFPVDDRGEDGFIGVAPVGCFEASAFGLYDMSGNVWEWTADAWRGDAARGVVKGGSYLCAESYCSRYRPAARQPYERDFSASHIGFRTVTGAGG